MTDWKVAMICVLPLMWGNNQKLRTWSAMFVGSVVAAFLPPMAIGAYIVIDSLSGGIVLSHPAGKAQRAIGLLFAIMVLFHIGFLAFTLLNSGVPNGELYLARQAQVGWAMFGLLFAWGVADVGKSVVDRHRRFVRALASIPSSP